jgi:nucleotide-binding universal stress UspA family protein
MYDDVLLATDGGPGTEGAIGRALDLARTFEATLHVLYVIDTGHEPPGLASDHREELRAAGERRARRATAAVRERAGELDVRTVREVREGSPYRRILEYADEAGVDLLVVGTHGRSGGGRVRLGSTAERVVERADVPVLVVRLADEADEDTAVPWSGHGAYDHVVLATDGSDAAERAADHGLALAERYGAEVHVVYVVDTTVYEFADAERSIVGPLERGGENAVEALASEARERGLPAGTHVLRGVPARTLLEYADGVDADLLAMGTRGPATAGERFLGSTTRRLLGRSGAPVLTVR